MNELIFNYIFSDALQQGASQFEQQAGALKRKMWMKNLKVGCIYISFFIKKITIYTKPISAKSQSI